MNSVAGRFNDAEAFQGRLRVGYQPFNGYGRRRALGRADFPQEHFRGRPPPRGGM